MCRAAFLAVRHAFAEPNDQCLTAQNHRFDHGILSNKMRMTILLVWCLLPMMSLGTGDESSQSPNPSVSPWRPSLLIPQQPKRLSMECKDIVDWVTRVEMEPGLQCPSIYHYCIS